MYVFIDFPFSSSSLFCMLGHQAQVLLAVRSSLLRNRTSILVAHRLSTAMSCDEILVLNKGQVVEQVG